MYLGQSREQRAEILALFMAKVLRKTWKNPRSGVPNVVANSREQVHVFCHSYHIRPNPGVYVCMQSTNYHQKIIIRCEQTKFTT